MEAGLFTLAGVIIGALLTSILTRSWQQEQWLLEKRREEYRELLSAITLAYMALANIGELRILGGLTREIQLDSERAIVESFRTLRDRIVIAGEIKSANSLDEWATAVQNYRRTNDERKFAARFSLINDRLIAMANSPPGKPHFVTRYWRKSKTHFALWRTRRNA